MACALREDVIVEHDEAVIDLRAGGAQRIAEIDLAGAVGREVFDQQGAGAGRELALDLRIAAEALRLLADVLHRQHQPVGDPGREGNARCLAAGDAIERLVADIAGDHLRGEVHQSVAQPRVGDDLAAVDIDRARPAGREDERLLGIEVDRLDLQHHTGGLLGDRLLVGRRGGKIAHVVSFGSRLCPRVEAPAGPARGGSG